MTRHRPCPDGICPRAAETEPVVFGRTQSTPSTPQGVEPKSTQSIPQGAAEYSGYPNGGQARSGGRKAASAPRRITVGYSEYPEYPTAHHRRVLRVPQASQRTSAHGSGFAPRPADVSITSDARAWIPISGSLQQHRHLPPLATTTTISGDGVLRRFPCTRSTKAVPLLESVQCSRCNLFRKLSSHSEG